MPTPATDGGAVVTAGATSIAVALRIRTRSGIATAGATSIAVAESMPRELGELTTREPAAPLPSHASYQHQYVSNSDFSKIPDAGLGVTIVDGDPDAGLDDWDGPTFVSGTRPTWKVVADSATPSGYALEATFTAGSTGDESRFEQLVFIRGSYAQTFAHFARADYTRVTASANAFQGFLELQYLDAGFAPVGNATSSTNTPTIDGPQALGVQAHASSGSIVPRAARWLRIRFGFRRTGSASATGTFRFYDVEIDSSPFGETLLPDLAQSAFVSAGKVMQVGGATILGPDGAGTVYLRQSVAEETRIKPAAGENVWINTSAGGTLSVDYYSGTPSAPSKGDYRIYARNALGLRALYGMNTDGVERRLDTVVGTDAQAWDADLDALAALASTGILVRTAANTYALRSLAAPAAGITISNAGGVSGNPTLALADDLAGLEAITGTGLVARTAANTYATRTLTGPAAGISVSNGDGVSGNPTLALANDLSALEALSSTGLAARTTTDTWAQRTLTAPAAGITISNAGGAAGNPTFALANDLDALESLASTGFAVRSATDTWVQRSLTAPAAGITITNPGGASGSPTFALADDLAALEALTGTGYAVRTGASAWALYSLPDVQAASSGSGNWSKPTGGLWTYVLVIGAGGGGGSGRRGAAGSVRAGGGGGGGGAVTEAFYLTSSLGATVAYAVGAAGSGGTAVVTNDTNGTAGAAGGDSSFGTQKASGGGGGGAGTNAGAGAGGAGGTAFGEMAGRDGGAGSGALGASAGASQSHGVGAPGGGGACGISAADVSGTPGGDGGGMVRFTLAAGTGGSTAGPTAPTAGATPTAAAWNGTGGGGGVNATGSRGGGAGGRGAGGGGSAGTLNGTTAPAGGDGGGGYVLVVTV